MTEEEQIKKITKEKSVDYDQKLRELSDTLEK
jgi:hypothetical protein